LYKHTYTLTYKSLVLFLFSKTIYWKNHQ